ELVVAVEKMNSFLNMKKTRSYSFQQAEIVELGLVVVFGKLEEFETWGISISDVYFSYGSFEHDDG
ncbi:hypothetical protein HAX54_007860, partial [Datura stramonium]|nr:hypothetical protein [Datura stramonium]